MNEDNHILWPGEQKAVAMVLKAGARYGYGNIIAHLKKAWAETLIKEYGLPVQTAIEAADTSPYPIETGGEG